MIVYNTESLPIIHRLCPWIEAFYILGVAFDTALNMHAAVRELAVQAGWRLRALLRTARSFTVREMVVLYKSQILSYIEAGPAAFFHAPLSTTSPPTRIQSRFVRSVDPTGANAFLDRNLASLDCICSVAALGVLQRRVLGRCPLPIAEI